MGQLAPWLLTALPGGVALGARAALREVTRVGALQHHPAQALRTAIHKTPERVVRWEVLVVMGSPVAHDVEEAWTHPTLLS